MAFQPGNQEAKKANRDKSFAQMLRVAITEAGREPGTTKLRDVADSLVKEAIDGNINAIKEIADRLDGKVPQGIAGEDGAPIAITFRIGGD
jgi:hypothetical protein